MTTNQPTWKTIANIGDVDPIAYGGFFVKVDETGVYPPEAEVLINDDDQWKVYRFCLDRCMFIDGVLSDNPYHPEHSAWFGLRPADRPQDSGLEDVASYAGYSVEDLIRLLCSESLIDRADAYRSIGEYYGYENLDAYPMTLTRTETEQRYADYAEDRE